MKSTTKPSKTSHSPQPTKNQAFRKLPSPILVLIIFGVGSVLINLDLWKEHEDDENIRAVGDKGYGSEDGSGSDSSRSPLEDWEIMEFDTEEVEV